MKKRPKSSYALAKQIVADYLESLEEHVHERGTIHFDKKDHLLVSAIEKAIETNRRHAREKERKIWHDAINAGRLTFVSPAK